MSPGWQAFIVITAMGLIAAVGIVLVRRAETREDEQQLRAGVQDVLNRYASHRTYSSGAAAESPYSEAGGSARAGVAGASSSPPPAPQTLVGAAVPRPGAPTRLHRRRGVADHLAATRPARDRARTGRSLTLEIRRQRAAIWEHRHGDIQPPRPGRGERQ